MMCSQAFSQSGLTGLVQRSHHWSPLTEEVSMMETQKDKKRAVYSSPKDRHFEPLLETLIRFGLVDTYRGKREGTREAEFGEGKV